MIQQFSDRIETWLHWSFEIGVVLKAISAGLELLFGLLLLFIDIRAIVQPFIDNELIDDPNDFLATHLQSAVANLSPGAELYSALYLLSHGIVKAALVGGLLRKKLWAYPASMVVLWLFIAYQTIKWIQTHSVALLLLTLFDLLLVYLIWHEYQHMRKQWAVGARQGTDAV